MKTARLPLAVVEVLCIFTFSASSQLIWEWGDRTGTVEVWSTSGAIAPNSYKTDIRIPWNTKTGSGWFIQLLLINPFNGPAVNYDHIRQTLTIAYDAEDYTASLYIVALMVQNPLMEPRDQSANSGSADSNSS